MILPLSGCIVPSTKPSTSSTKRYKLDHDKGPHHTEKIPNVHEIPDAKPVAIPKSKIGNPKTYTVFKKSYQVLPSSKGYKERGKASWYGKKFHGYHTSNGEIYDMYGMSAAHKTLPLPTFAKVTNVDNGKSVIVKINDRGPFHGDRIIDLSYAAATKLGILHKGTANVEIEAIEPSMPNLKKYLQVAAFTKEANAKKMAAQLKTITKDHPIKIKQHKSKSKILYLVHIGPIHDEQVLMNLRTHLIANKYPNPIDIHVD
jgi:rare lipoprotein A